MKLLSLSSIPKKAGQSKLRRAKRIKTVYNKRANLMIKYLEDAINYLEDAISKTYNHCVKLSK